MQVYMPESSRCKSAKGGKKETVMNTKLQNISIAESFQFAFGYCVYIRQARRAQRRKKFPIKECSMQKSVFGDCLEQHQHRYYQRKTITKEY